MKPRRIIVLLSVLLLALVLSVSPLVLNRHVVRATHNVPDITCGARQCVGEVDWGASGNSGGLVTVYVPSYTGSSTNYLARGINFVSGTDELTVGYCFGTFPGVATCANSGDYFFAYNGTQAFIAIPSSDKTHTVQIGAQPDVAVGMDIYINQDNSGTNPCNPCQN